MKLKSIWTLPGYSFRERVQRTRDWLADFIARHLPTRLQYMVTINQIAKATRHSRDIPSTTVDEVLRKIDRPKHLS